MKKGKKPRKPVDSTMRNVRAANKRLDALEAEVKMLGTLIYKLIEMRGVRIEQPKRKRK